MQIKTASDIVSLNNTNKPFVVSGVPRSGTTFLARTLYKQLKINNPSKPIGYMDEICRYVPGVIEYTWDDVPVLKDIQFDRDVKPITEKAGAPNELYDKDKYGIELVQDDLVRLTDRLKKVKEYPLDNILGKIFTQDLHIIKQVDEDYYNKLIDEYFWLYCYREKYIEGIISMLYAFNTMYYHYFDSSIIKSPWQEESLYIDPSNVKNVVLLLYGGVTDMFKTASIEFIPFSQLTELEDNTDEYMGLERNSLYPPDVWMVPPKYIADKPKKLETLIDNYDELYTKAKKLMKVYARKEPLIHLSEDGESLWLK